MPVLILNSTLLGLCLQRRAIETGVWRNFFLRITGPTFGDGDLEFERAVGSWGNRALDGVQSMPRCVLPHIPLHTCDAVPGLLLAAESTSTTLRSPLKGGGLRGSLWSHHRVAFE